MQANKLRDLIYKHITENEYLTNIELRELIKPYNYLTAKNYISILVKNGLIRSIKKGSFLVFLQDVKKKRISNETMSRVTYLHSKTVVYNNEKSGNDKYNDFKITDIQSDRALQGYSNMLTYFLSCMLEKGKIDEAKKLVSTNLYKVWIDCIDSIDYTKLIPNK